MESEEDFEQFKGKLDGKIVLLSEEREPNERSEPVFVRFNKQELQDQHKFEMPDRPEKQSGEFEAELTFREDLVQFLEREGALAMVRASRKEFGMLAAEGGLNGVDNTPGIPGIVLAREDYDRLIRLLRRDETVRLSIDVSAQFYDDDHKPRIKMSTRHHDFGS